MSENPNLCFWIEYDSVISVFGFSVSAKKSGDVTDLQIGVKVFDRDVLCSLSLLLVFFLLCSLDVLRMTTVLDIGDFGDEHSNGVHLLWNPISSYCCISGTCV